MKKHKVRYFRFYLIPMGRVNAFAPLRTIKMQRMALLQTAYAKPCMQALTQHRNCGTMAMMNDNGRVFA
ncbi:MAG: hypothetical protein IJ354_00600 [Clostridia bacterium]|nr:hypothetical protein [Clostridia bacterium]